MDLSKPWNEYSFVAFDTETAGAYPIGYDICEFGAVKWRQGHLETFQTLLKPREVMSDFVIGIHGISNQMVESAPTISEKIDEIAHFFKDSVLLAHHAPFDLGFLAYDFERHFKPLPKEIALCTSLISRKIIGEAENHRLQTLIKVLNLEGGTAHRALDDANACLQLALKCFERMGPISLNEVIEKTQSAFRWEQFSVQALRQEIRSVFVEAILQKKDIDMVYEGGSIKDKPRRITPVGLVRNPEGDYVQATCHIDRALKRFYLARIRDAAICY